jgi:hypothetical protein
MCCEELKFGGVELLKVPPPDCVNGGSELHRRSDFPGREEAVITGSGLARGAGAAIQLAWLRRSSVLATIRC